MATAQEKHDVRTALAIVRGGADVLSRHGAVPPDRWDLACDLVIHGLERLRELDPSLLERESLDHS